MFWLGASFVPLTTDPLARNIRIPAIRRLWLGLWHALLPAMLSALILHAFEIVFLWHRGIL